MSVQKPSWRSWLARQSHNLKVVSSSLTEGILFLPQRSFLIFHVFPHQNSLADSFQLSDNKFNHQSAACDDDSLFRLLKSCFPML